MANDDDLSKTMVIPNPGGRRVSANLGQVNVSAPQSVMGNTHEASHVASVSQSVSLNSENALLALAAELINLASNMRTLTPNNSTEQLRYDIEGFIDRFDKQLNQHSTPTEIALTARYLICCLVDELILSTPWGHESSWARQTLLSKYHNETSGGERFFVIVNKLMEQPQRNIDLIELSYLCVSIGFKGKYRLSQNSENDILQISNLMYQAITLYRPVGIELSPCWRAEIGQDASIEGRISLPLLWLFLGFICIAVYIGFLSHLHATSSPLYAQIESIGWQEDIYNATLTQIEPPSPKVEKKRMAQALNTALELAVSNNLVAVIEHSNFVAIRFISPQLFASGSTNVNETALPSASVILNAIRPFTNTVVIVGHTDSTGRAESNWSISRKRAESIQSWLQFNHSQSGSGSLSTTTRGVADTQPIIEQKDASKNRRVELLIFPQEGV